MNYKPKSIRCYTNYKTNVLPNEEATNLFIFLKNNIVWEEGIRSKKGFTRKAKTLTMGCIPQVDDAVIKILSQMTKISYAINGIYLNYYENGEMWTPNHSHKGSHQLIISLGQTRTLNVAKKKYQMENGSAIMFGSSIHGVPKDNSKEGRISIATFMTPVEKIKPIIYSDEELALKLQMEEWSH